MKLNVINLEKHIENSYVIIKFNCAESSKYELMNLESGKDYEFEVVSKKKKRSLNQNALLWKLIADICEAENGTKAETEDIYLNLLEETGAKVDFLQGIPESFQTLCEYFRIVKIVDERIENGTKTYVYKCWSGSSNFDTAQMNKLIDKAIERAEYDGLNVEYWNEQF